MQKKEGNKITNKKGLSAVVTTLIIILLVLIAVAIIWTVIQRAISRSSEEISFERFTVRLSIDKTSVKVSQDKKISLKVHRDSGRGDLSKIKFILSDEEKSYSEEIETDLKELDDETFVISYAGELEKVKKISIAAIIKTSDVGERLGEILDSANVPEQWWTKSPSEIKILVIENKSSTWINELKTLEYNVMVNETITTKSDIDAKNPDIVACFQENIKCVKSSLYNDLYNAGYSIFTEGNDNNASLDIIKKSNYDSGSNITITPTKEPCAEPLIYGWTEASDGFDIRNKIVEVHEHACAIAKDSSNTEFGAIYLEEKGGGGKWFHYQLKSVALDQLINNAMKYLAR